MRNLLVLVVLLLCAATVEARPGSLYYHEPQIVVHILAQTGGACGTGIAHCTVISWTASTTAGVTYNVYRGTVSGGESAVAQNVAPITGLSYIDPVTLTSNPQTFFYYIEAVETSGTITANSVPSPEVSATFPGTPAAPTLPVAAPH